jgi:hypothetical protein
MAAQLHLAEEAFTLHLLFQHLESLVDIVVTDENLHAAFLYDRAIEGTDGQGRSGHWRAYVHNSVADCAQDTNAGYEPLSILKLCLPMGTPSLPIGRKEDFGRSPFFGQLFKRVSARV